MKGYIQLLLLFTGLAAIVAILNNFQEQQLQSGSEVDMAAVVSSSLPRYT